ncbi:TAXI family TRAP transporter solute-binding subunit [Amycolatopsis albispora]|uniref:C4-dicarboxylate ABC transporter substrate-binding protein n=1 Tax=Amycolatopsis albispora TaxID=1804986 RepID=A0A344L4P6_9PSEU|nr:TAXI family TRAP transporter solute-binding subunit [Amycolatopsis albispora]AXB43020.1 C4-dicarboxylate ABC transporter substrate-binding protein [Amycolatopsis albispora]
MRRRSLLLGGLALLATGCAGGGYRGPERKLTIAAGERGGFYLAFAELLAAEIAKAEPALHCEAVVTEASVANVNQVRDGTVDLGMVLADVGQSAVRGQDPFPGPVPLRALGRVYENYLQVVVRADGPVRDLAGLAGRPVAIGSRFSGAAFLAQRMLVLSGIEVEPSTLLLDDAIAALRERRVDALIWSGGVPTPAITELDRETPIRLLALDRALPLLRSVHGPVYEQVRVPAGAYEGVGDVPTIGTANLLACSPALPDDVAAAVVRVLVGHAADLVPAEAVGAQFLDVRTLIGTGEVPLHPGAVRTYRELHG